MSEFPKLPAIVHFCIAAVVSTASLLLSQGFIDNRTEKLVAGLGAIWIPIAYLILVALFRLAGARETAARIMSGQPTRKLPG
jgi:hypothetical protein